MYSVFKAMPSSTSLSPEECTNSAERLLMSSVSGRCHHSEALPSSKTPSENSNKNNRDSGTFLNYMLNQHRSNGIFIFEPPHTVHVNSGVRELPHVNNHPSALDVTSSKLSETVPMDRVCKQIQSSSINVPLEIQINNIPIVRPNSSSLPCSISDKTGASTAPEVTSTSSKCPQTGPIVSVVEDTNNSTEESNVNSEYEFSEVIEHPTNSSPQNSETRNDVVCCMNCQRCFHSIFCFYHIDVCCHKDISSEMQVKRPSYSVCFNSVGKQPSIHGRTQLCCCTRPAAVKSVVSHCLDSLDKERMSTVVAGGSFIACRSGGCGNISNEVNRNAHCVDETHTCEICFKSYSSSSALANHTRYHRGERPYQCETCNKAFATNSHLVTHRRVHTGERPFQCQTCHRSFADRSAFIKHERTHGPNGSIVKRFKCEECGNAFVDSCGLKKHMRIHTGERPYKCSVCEKSFSTSSTFVAHKRIHSGERPYKCDQCSKMFVTKSHLLTHRRVHTGEKPFTCQICSRSFADGSSFRRHERLHTGENKHVCELCGKGFPCSTSLAKHKQAHISGSTSFMYMM